MKNQTIYFSGISGETGTWADPPISEKALAQQLFQTIEPNMIDCQPRCPAFATKTDRLEETGWALIVPLAKKKQYQDYLKPLICFRRRRAGALFEQRFKVLTYHPSETMEGFITRIGAPNPGLPVNPDRLPYFLLLAGGPDEIPFEFQVNLAADYAVGRLALDTADDYRRYAEAVKRRESNPTFSRQIKVSLFGPQHKDDPITPLMRQHLLEPLISDLSVEPNAALSRFLGDAADKPTLARLLNGSEAPDLLFTATHGLVYAASSRHLKNRQGALVCREWHGPKRLDLRFTRDMWLEAKDLPKNPVLNGMICFLFGCHTAATPQLDALLPPNQPSESHLAPKDFMAALPKRLLSAENGAGAIIAHVDRTWEYGFVRNRRQAQAEGFKSCLRAILHGQPVGFGLSFLTGRAPALAMALIKSHMAEGSSIRSLHAWLQYHDARTYVILGDPACRLGGRRAAD